MVLIVLGSASDEKYLEKCTEFLKQMEVPYKVKVASAHRSPKRVLEILEEYDGKAKVIIAFAGHAAHLAGAIAGHATIPVIAVPLPTSDLDGLDALLSCVQMPGGVPVATMAVGKSGSQNAACFAAQILALNDSALAERFRAYKGGLATKVANASKEIESKWGD